jgi:hypothetical protein
LSATQVGDLHLRPGVKFRLLLCKHGTII